MALGFVTRNFRYKALALANLYFGLDTRPTVGAAGFSAEQLLGAALP